MCDPTAAVQAFSATQALRGDGVQNPVFSGSIRQFGGLAETASVPTRVRSLQVRAGRESHAAQQQLR